MLSSFFSQPQRSRCLMVLRDQSGSMSHYNDALDKACLSLESAYHAPESAYALHFVAFANLGNVGDSASIRNLMHIRGGTSIAQSFERAARLAGKMQPVVKFDSVTLVFISDGEDNKPFECLEALSLLPRMPCPSRFLCVGCCGFPTNLASGRLFELFGGLNHPCEPLVLPCPDAMFVPAVFAELRRLLDAPDERPPPALSDLAPGMGVAALVAEAKRAYNAAVSSCLYTKEVPEARAFGECKAFLARVRQELCHHVKQEKLKSRGRLPLSARLGLCASEAASQVARAVFVVDAMQKKANECLCRALCGNLAGNLDDHAKLDVVGLTGQVGLRLASKALHYHGVNTDRVKESFLRFLEQYPGASEADAAVRGQCGTTLFDACADAKSVLRALRDPSFTVGDMVAKFPQFGYPVTVHVPAGAVMNPYLIEVSRVDLSSVVQARALRSALQAPDPDDFDAFLDAFFEACTDDDEDEDAEKGGQDEEEALRKQPPAAGEKANCLLLIASAHSGQDTSFFKFMASALLFRSDHVYHNEAHLSVSAACVARILEDGASGPGVREGLASVLRSLKAAYPSWPSHYGDYLKAMQCSWGFRRCLVTQDPSLPKGMTCPHLTKAVFTMWLVGAEVRPWTAEELNLRQLAVVIEMFHRAGRGSAWLPLEFDLDQSCEAVAAELLPGGNPAQLLAYGPTCRKALAASLPSLLGPFKDALKRSPEQYLAPPRLDMPAVEATRYHQFSLASVQAMFRGLAELSGLGRGAIKELGPCELARCLEVAAISDNVKRNSVLVYELPVPQEIFANNGYKAGYGKLVERVTECLADAFTRAYTQASQAAHVGSVVRLDAASVLQWPLGGVTAFNALDIDTKTGLSRTTCLCQTCPYYLKPLGTSNRKGRMSPALKAHLEGLVYIPGLHKAVFGRSPRKMWETQAQYEARLAALILAGDHLDKTHPEEDSIILKVAKLDTPRELGEKQEAYEGRVADAVRAGALGRSVCGRELMQGLRDYGEKAMAMIHSKFADPAEVGKVVRAVSSTGVLGKKETHELLTWHFQA